MAAFPLFGRARATLIGTRTIAIAMLFSAGPTGYITRILPVVDSILIFAHRRIIETSGFSAASLIERIVTDAAMLASVGIHCAVTRDQAPAVDTSLIRDWAIPKRLSLLIAFSGSIPQDAPGDFSADSRIND